MKFLFCLFLLLSGLRLAASADELRLGTGSAVITPPVGTPLAGYYRKRLSDGALDDLFAKAVVLEQGGVKAAIVSVDIMTLPRHTIESARKLIEEKILIPGSQVMIGATHSHTSPVVSGENTRDRLDGGDSEEAKRYTAALPGLIARSVDAANQNLRIVRVSGAIAHETGVSFNRRFWMRDGQVSWNPPKLDKGVLRPAGPIDPEIGFLYFDTPDATPAASIVNFALHADTTGGTKVSADYMGHLARLLGEVKGADMLTLYLLGACGNINHRDIDWADRQSGRGESFRIGSVLAGAINRSWGHLKPIEPGRLQIRSEVIKLPLAPISVEDVRKANEVLSRMTDPKTTFLEQVKTFQTLDIEKRNGRPLEVEAQAITIGREIAFVSLPGEVFVELGLSIKKASPFPYTMIMELANGSIGYIPNKSAYSEGNYEVISARCAAGSGETLAATAAKLLAEMYDTARNMKGN